MGKYNKKWLNLDPSNDGLTAKDLAFTPIRTVAEELDNKANRRTNIPVIRIGDLNYLPVDIKGSFKSASNCFRSFGPILIEKSGELVLLRIGYDGWYTRLFYSYSVTRDLSSIIHTDVEYRPPFLNDDEYIAWYYHGNQDVGFCVLVLNKTNNDYKFYWIEHHGTLDFRYHTYKDISPILTSIVPPPPYTDVDPAPTLKCVNYIPELDLYIRTTTNELAIFDSSFNQIASATMSPNDIESYPYKNIERTGGSYGHTHNPCSYYYFNDDGTVHIVVTQGVRFFYTSAYAIVFGVFYDFDFNPSTGELVKHDLPPFDPYDINNYPYTNAFHLFRTNAFFIYPQETYIWEKEGDQACRFMLSRIDRQFDSFKEFHQTVQNDVRILLQRDYIQYIDDASLLGKTVKYAHWVTYDTLVVNSNHKAPNESLKSVWSRNTVDPTSTASIWTPNDALQAPTHTELAKDKELLIRHTRIENGQYIGITRQINSIFYKSIDGVNFDVYDDLTNTDWYNKIKNSLESMYPSQLFAISNPTPLNDGYYFVMAVRKLAMSTAFTYSTWQHINGDFVQVDPWIDLTSLTSTYPYAYGWQPWNGVYITSTNVYMIYIGPAQGNTAGNRTPIFIAKFDLQGHMQDYIIRNWLPSWKTPTVGIHPYFGPYFGRGFYSANAKYAHKYMDNTTISNLDDRMIACFNDWFDTTISWSSKFVITLRSAEGFILYNSKYPIFTRGDVYYHEASSYDLTSDYNISELQNTKLYVYLEFYEQSVRLKAYKTLQPESYNRYLICTLETDDVKITNIIFVDRTFVDFYRTSEYTRKNALVCSFTEPTFDEQYVPYLVKGTQVDVNGTVIPITNAKLIRVVAKLDQLSNTEFEKTIVLGNVNKIHAVLVTNVNSGDGYSSPFDSNTYYNVYTTNVQDTSFTVRIRTGNVVLPEFIWVHCIVIAE